MNGRKSLKKDVLAGQFQKQNNVQKSSKQSCNNIGSISVKTGVKIEQLCHYQLHRLHTTRKRTLANPSAMPKEDIDRSQSFVFFCLQNLYHTHTHTHTHTPTHHPISTHKFIHQTVCFQCDVFTPKKTFAHCDIIPCDFGLSCICVHVCFDDQQITTP